MKSVFGEIIISTKLMKTLYSYLQNLNDSSPLYDSVNGPEDAHDVTPVIVSIVYNTFHVRPL